MEELLKKLFEADVLNEDTRNELDAAFKERIEIVEDEARQNAAADVEARLTEAFVIEKERMVEAVDAKVTDMVANEVAELKEDLEKFRDLEAEYAIKLTEAKAAMASEVQGDMSELVDKIDAFMEIKIEEEMAELKEDIQVARQHEFGRRIFEAVKEEFVSTFHNEDEASVTYAELESRLESTQAALEESEQLQAEMLREQKLAEILEPLSGQTREVMETVLQNVATDNLVEGYKQFLPRIIRDTETTEKEANKVLSESAEVNEDETVTEGEVTIITGDTETSAIDDQTDASLTEGYDNELSRMLRIAGIGG